MLKFGQVISDYDWKCVYNECEVEKKVENFHLFLRKQFEEYFPEKQIKIDNLDKKSRMSEDAIQSTLN